MNLVGRLIRFELRIWRSLLLWVTRRKPGRTESSRAFPYARDVTPLLCAFLFVSLLELPVVHLLLPWPSVRLVALVLSVWGLLWMLGYLAAMRVFPHLLDRDGIRVRHGAGVDVRIPWDAVAKVSAARDDAPSNKAVQIEDEPGGRVAVVPILKQTRVRVQLREPLALRFPDGPQEVVGVRLYVDDPRAFVTAARELAEA